MDGAQETFASETALKSLTPQSHQAYQGLSHSHQV